MTVVITRDVADRIRGFLASCMLEIAPGVYTAPRMNRAVRERMWDVIEEWYTQLGGGCIVMTWRDVSAPGGQQIAVLGAPPCEIYCHGDIFLARRDLTKDPSPASEPDRKRADEDA